MVIVAPNSQGVSGIDTKDDGTNYVVLVNGTKILDVNKSNGNVSIKGDIKTRKTL